MVRQLIKAALPGAYREFGFSGWYAEDKLNNLKAHLDEHVDFAQEVLVEYDPKLPGRALSYKDEWVLTIAVDKLCETLNLNPEFIVEVEVTVVDTNRFSAYPESYNIRFVLFDQEHRRLDEYVYRSHTFVSCFSKLSNLIAQWGLCEVYKEASGEVIFKNPLGQGVRVGRWK